MMLGRLGRWVGGATPPPTSPGSILNTKQGIQNLLPSASFSTSTTGGGKATTTTDATDSDAPVRRLVCGLGNVGSQFDGTRHNIGFDVVRHFAQHYGQNHEPHQTPQFTDQRELSAAMYSYTSVFSYDPKNPFGVDLVDYHSERRRLRTIADRVPHPKVDVSLMLPTTYMNLSGAAVRKFVDKHRFRLKSNPQSNSKMDDLLVIADDVNLPFGMLRFASKGGHDGQNGVSDVRKRLGVSRFNRLRIGIGPRAASGSVDNRGMHKAAFVLDKFDIWEREEMPDVLWLASEVIRVYLHRGATAAIPIANSHPARLAVEKYKGDRSSSSSSSSNSSSNSSSSASGQQGGGGGGGKKVVVGGKRQRRGGGGLWSSNEGMKKRKMAEGEGGGGGGGGSSPGLEILSPLWWMMMMMMDSFLMMMGMIRRVVMKRGGRREQ